MMNSEKSKSEIIDQLFSNRKIDQLAQYIEGRPDIELIELHDSQGNTVLNQLAYEGHLDIIRLFVSKAKRVLEKKKETKKKNLYEKNSNQQITAWMNIQNNQGFTPLLYASYNGHMDIIRFLVEEYQVNVHLTTKSGLNPIHLAAQKNVVLPIIYFKDRIGINDVDASGSTPLHWASYMGSQQVLSYLLSCHDLNSLDLKDQEGNTPLMMAVNYANTRVARKLLMKGANRYLKNKNNQTPLEVARSSQYKVIEKMLSQKYSCWDQIKFYCNVKIEYKPKKRNLTFPIIFIIGFLLNVAILNTLISFTSLYSLVIECVIFGVMFLLFLSLLKGPPPITQQTELGDLLKGTEKGVKDFCFHCRINIPKRGYHCQICGICIQQYDHHCTWINNCVGKRNIARFILYLLFLILTLGFVGLVSFLSAISIFINQPNVYRIWFVFRFQNLQTYENALALFLLAINLFSSLFVLPLLALFVVQVKNLLKNKTTYETYRAPKQQSNQMKDRIRKYDSRVSFRNCKIMCSDAFSSSSKSSSNKQLITGDSSSK